MSSSIGNVFAIAGCTNSGKTTLAEAVSKMLKNDGASVKVINQDDYFYEAHLVEKIWKNNLSSTSNGVTVENGDGDFYYQYDEKEAIDDRKMLEDIRKAIVEFDHVVIEGIMLTEWPELVEITSRIVFLTLDLKTCRRRRSRRHYDPPDVEGLFDDVVWPSYQGHLARALQLARTNPKLTFLDVSKPNDVEDVVDDKGVQELIRSIFNDSVHIGSGKLSVEDAMRHVSSPSCGGTSIFVGTTRDIFDGKKVRRLDYEAYDEMAYAQLRRLCSQVRRKFPAIEKMAIYHRIGEVPVEEASVIIATSSAHRREAIEATSMAIDVLKEKVPIWKKEIYEDGTCSWKSNSECCGKKKAATEKTDNNCGDTRREPSNSANFEQIRQCSAGLRID